MQKLSAKWVPKCLDADQKRQKCQSSEQLLEFFLRDPNDFLSRHDWWSWKKPGYITLTRRQSNNRCNNRWSGGTAPHPAQKNSESKNSLEKFSPRFFWDQDGIVLIDYLPKGQTINADYYLFLLVHLKDILKEKRRPREGHQGGLVLARQCPGSPGTCNPKETGLPGLPVSWSHTLFSGSGPFGLTLVPWTEKNIWNFAIFRPIRRSLVPRRPDLISEFFWVVCES